MRNFNTVGMYQTLDHGACPIPGSTEPVERFDERSRQPLFVPSKCTDCEYLKNDEIRGYICLYQQELWGSFPRSLDWGDWRPEFDPIGIEGKVVTTVELRALIADGHTARAVVELKRLYPGLSTHAALSCVSIFKERIAASNQDC
ncbi:hypothetical protein ACPA5B_12345 [Pseudomonas solani]|uniref:hypothetical protein n=1 Tax=Pseudomonas solani TaxID=2731552 RepID=UPI003C307461